MRHYFYRAESASRVVVLVNYWGFWEDARRHADELRQRGYTVRAVNGDEVNMVRREVAAQAKAARP